MYETNLISDQMVKLNKEKLLQSISPTFYYSQFHQHFMSSFSSNFLLSKLNCHSIIQFSMSRFSI